MAGIKRLLLGNPLHNREAAHQRLSNPVALAGFGDLMMLVRMFMFVHEFKL